MKKTVSRYSTPLEMKYHHNAAAICEGTGGDGGGRGDGTLVSMRKTSTTISRQVIFHNFRASCDLSRGMFMPLLESVD